MAAFVVTMTYLLKWLFICGGREGIAQKEIVAYFRRNQSFA